MRENKFLNAVSSPKFCDYVFKNCDVRIGILSESLTKKCNKRRLKYLMKTYASSEEELHNLYNVLKLRKFVKTKSPTYYNLLTFSVRYFLMRAY